MPVGICVSVSVCMRNVKKREKILSLKSIHVHSVFSENMSKGLSVQADSVCVCVCVCVSAYMRDACLNHFLLRQKEDMHIHIKH